MRLAQFSDVHFTDLPTRIPWRDLFSKRILGWANLALMGRYATFAGARTVVEALLRDLEEVRPDSIVSTGDLTGLALPSEFEEARSALAPLLASPLVTGIPGNHDVYVRSALERKLYEEAFGAWTRTDLLPADFPEDHRSSYPYPLLRLLGPSAALVVLMDVRPNAFHDSTGVVPEPQLRLLERILADARLEGRLKVIALHTSFCRADCSPERRLHGLRNADALLSVATRGGAALIIHGHIHHRFVIPAGRLHPFAIANPGSLTSRRHERAYHIYELEGGKIRLEARRFDEERRAFVPWPDAPGAGLIFPPAVVP